MYHEPPKAARIIMACSVLHNVARRLRLPEPDLDEGYDELDAYMPAMNPRAQP